MTPPEEVTRAFALHRRRIEAIAARILRDAEEASDVASETFISLIENGPDDPDSVAAWLNVSARNRALNRLRARSRAQRREQLVADVPDEQVRHRDVRIAELLWAAA